MSSELELRPLTDDRISEWETFVENSERATVFHTLGWLTAVETEFGYEPSHALAYEDPGDDPVAIVPGFTVGTIGGTIIVNPFCEYGFPLVAPDSDDVRVLSRLADDLGFLETRILKGVEWSGVKGYNEAGFGGVRTGVSPRLWLDRSYEELWNRSFEKQIRTPVRTAEDRGLTVSEGTLDEFYSLYLQTMRRLGSPPFPESFFETLSTGLEDAVTPIVAYLSGKPIGSILLLEWGEQTIMWGNGSLEEYWSYRPNQLLYARCIERACDRGQSVVDFGRTRYGTGVHEFKSHFGAVDCELTSFVTPPHRVREASVDQYDKLKPITRRLAPLITHPTIGPKLKRMIHE